MKEELYAAVDNFVSDHFATEHPALRGAVRRTRELIDSGTEPFDLIFVDTDRPLYLQYFQLSLSLSHPGTLIVADNVIREGQILETDAPDEKVEGVQRLLNYLERSSEATTTLLQTVGAKGHDGMALIVVN